jgi:GINS complex subunit 2
MALPSNLVAGLLPTEAEFIATSSVEINVVPLMRIDKVRLLGGVYGPLRPPAQARLPLWFALNLKKRKRCSVVCPDWMQVGK